MGVVLGPDGEAAARRLPSSARLFLRIELSHGDLE
jgi:hypothetical protein